MRKSKNEKRKKSIFKIIFLFAGAIASLYVFAILPGKLAEKSLKNIINDKPDESDEEIIFEDADYIDEDVI